MKFIAVSIFRYGHSTVELLVEEYGRQILVRRDIATADPDLTKRVFAGADMLNARKFYMGWVADAVEMTGRFDVVRFMHSPPEWAVSDKGE